VLKAMQRAAEQGESESEEQKPECPRCNDTGMMKLADGRAPCPCRQEKAEQKARQKRLSQGKDELNLCVLSFADFGAGRRQRRFAISRRWRQGHTHPFALEATGHPELGIPTARDQDLCFALEQLTPRQPKDHEIGFQPSDLLQQIGRTKGSVYGHTRRGLDRLSGLLIHEWQGWFAMGSGATTVGDFRILERYHWPTQKEIREGADPRCYFVWGEPILESMRRGAWRSVALDLYHQLRSPIARFAYRYALRCLHNRRDGRHTGNTRDFYQGVLGLGWKIDSPKLMTKVLQRHLAELPKICGIEVRISERQIEFRTV